MKNYVNEIIEEQSEKEVLAYLKERGFHKNQISLQEENLKNPSFTKIDPEVAKLLPSSSLLCNINGNTNDDSNKFNHSVDEDENKKYEDNRSMDEYESCDSFQHLGFDHTYYENPIGKDLGYNKSGFDIDDGGYDGRSSQLDCSYLLYKSTMPYTYEIQISTRNGNELVVQEEG